MKDKKHKRIAKAIREAYTCDLVDELERRTLAVSSVTLPPSVEEATVKAPGGTTVLTIYD